MKESKVGATDNPEDIHVVQTNTLRSALILGLLTAPGVAPVVIAAEKGAEVIEEIVVVGSRRRDRSAGHSPVPVDVITGDDFRNQGDSDMDSLLSSLVPSYNVSQEPISDAATLIRPATLRGLPPDATLVLVNGKRRHRAAVIALLGAGVSGGSQGPDLSVIPAIALDRLEVLRDGASAQYGSDAIAGIMNFVLKEDREGGSVEAKLGSFYEGDGEGAIIAANIGLPLSDVGFANFSFEWKEVGPTSRSVQRGDAQGLIDAGNSSVRQPAAQIWGAPEIFDDYKTFANFGVDLGNGGEAYAFGNLASRQVEGGFFYRNPHTRNGVFKGGIVDGSPTVKVADLTGDMSGNCPVVKITNNVPDAGALAVIRNDPNCYSLIEKFPGGFTPQFGGYIEDSSLTGGVRGQLSSDWHYDLSVSGGRSNAKFYIYNTINPQLLSLRNDIPVYYDAGAYTELDRTVNFDVSKLFEVGLWGELNVAAGMEHREETFKIENGDPNSFFIDDNLAAQGFGIGSNGFAGFQPGDAGSNTSSSYAVYVDLEADVTETLLLGGALRYEDYQQFGDTLNGKLAARLQVSDTVALRGAVSTGFRVPTAGQANLRNVTTEFNMGRLADIATLPPTHPIAMQKGGVALTPEESVNITLGAVVNAGLFDITVDYYNIEITDRVAFTKRFDLDANDIAALLAVGVTDASSFSAVRFFSNQQTVKASGVDLVVTAPLELFGGNSNLVVVGNWSDIELSEFNPDFVDNNLLRQIEAGRPDSRFSVTLNHSQEPWRFMARLRHYGTYYDAPTNDPDFAFEPDPSFVIDFEAALTVGESLIFVAGAQNAFDEYPSKNPHGDAAGLIYPESSPFGFNGGYYYVRAIWEFY